MENMETALLRIINNRGLQVSNSQIYKALEDGNYFKLQDQHLRATIYGGRPAYRHEVRSYLANLRKKGLIKRVSRGECEITESGKNNIAAPPFRGCIMEAKKANLNKDYEKEFSEKYYHLRARPTKAQNWWLGAQRRQIDSRLKCGALVLFCDDRARSETIFEIPFSYLRSHVFSRVQPNSKGAYKFHIDKKTYVVTWGTKGNKIKMEGVRFLIWSPSKQSLTSSAATLLMKSPHAQTITHEELVTKVILLEKRISRIEKQI